MSDADALRADIELTRAELARTIDALHGRLDVRAQARDRIDYAMSRAFVFVEENRTALLAGGAVLLALFVLRRGHNHDENTH